MTDDVRPKGYVTVPCAHPECTDGAGRTWHHWVDALDPRLPGGPFLCWDHDPKTAGIPMTKATP
jgi:hypothetical protein